MASNSERGESPLFQEITPQTPKHTDPSSNLEPNPVLSNGRILPKNLQAKIAESNSWGKPLQDVDPFYETKDTFVVVASNFRIWRFSSHNSLFLFDRINALRRFCLLVLTHWIFAAFMTAVVVIDFSVISLDHNRFLPRIVYSVIGYVCLLIYVIEFLLKLISMGFVLTPYTYLRSGWSWVDMLTIIDSIFGAVMDLGEPIRLLKIIPYNAGLHLAFGFYVSCIVKLKEMIISAVVIVSLFTLMGLQIYMGTLTQKCISNFNHTLLNDSEYGLYYEWELHHNNATNFYTLDPEVDYPLCGNASGSGQCPEGYTCMQGFGKNPDYGFTNFDSFGWGFLSVLRFITQDFAEALYRQIVTATSSFHGVYFVLMFFVGTFGLGTFAYAIIASHLLEMKRDLGGNQEDENMEHANKSHSSHVIFEYCLSWNFSPGFNSFRRKTHCFVFHPFTELCITFIIIQDIILMMFNVDQYVFSKIFCWIYVIEFLVKLFTESPRDYFHRAEHILDFIIIVIFTLTWFIDSSVLNSFLVLRMFKLYPRWPSLNFIIQAMINSVKTYRALFSFFIVIFFFVVTQFFFWFRFDEQRVHFFHGEEIPRWNYFDYEHSFLNVFRILIGDWIETLWDSMLVNGTFACIATIPTVFLLYLILMILSIAVVVTTGDTFTKIEFQENPLYSKLEQALKRICVPITWIRSKINPGGQTHDILEEAPIHGHHDTHGDLSTPTPANNENQRKSMMDLIIDNKYHNWISIAIILWSSIAIAMDDVHIHPYSHIVESNSQSAESETNPSAGASTSMIYLNIIFYSDIVFTIYFILDILINVFGCLMKKRFDKPGCLFDSLLIFDMILYLVLGHGILYVKSLRPFMLVSRIERLQVVVTGLLTEISLLWKYLLAGLFIWLAFDIQGVQLFSNQFYKCVDPEDGLTPDYRIIPHKMDCLMHNFTWENSYPNFDNAVEGFHAILAIATFIGWLRPFHNAEDIQGVDKQPVKDSSFHNSFYFVLFSIIGVFFVANIMVGILIHYLRKNTYQGIFMTFDQFYEYKGKLRQLESPSETTPEQKIPEPTSPFLKFFYDFVENHFFDKFIMFVIFLDILLLSFDHYNASPFYFWTIDIFEGIVTLIYFVEMVLKLLGWRLHYFKNTYNRWDFFIVLNMILGMILTDLVAMYFLSPMLLKLIRVFRIFQFEPFRRRAVVTQQYLSAFFLIKSSFFNLLWFLIVSIFSYALLFMSVFKHVKLRGGLDPLFNFQTFGSSVRMVVEFSNVAGWDGVNEGLGNETDCDLPDPEQNIPGNCGNAWASGLLIGSYITLSCLIVLNMYIIFILEIVRRVSKSEHVGALPPTLERNPAGRTHSALSSSSEQSSPSPIP